MHISDQKVVSLNFNLTCYCIKKRKKLFVHFRVGSRAQEHFPSPPWHLSPLLLTHLLFFSNFVLLCRGLNLCCNFKEDDLIREVDVDVVGCPLRFPLPSDLDYIESRSHLPSDFLGAYMCIYVCTHKVEVLIISLWLIVTGFIPKL